MSEFKFFDPFFIDSPYSIVCINSNGDVLAANNVAIINIFSYDKDYFEKLIQQKRKISIFDFFEDKILFQNSIQDSSVNSKRSIIINKIPDDITPYIKKKYQIDINCISDKFYKNEDLYLIKRFLRQYIISNEDHLIDLPIYICFIRIYIQPLETKELLDIQTSYLLNLINTMQDLVFVKNNARKYIIVNSVFEKYFLRSKDFLIGKSNDEVFGEVSSSIFVTSDQYVLKNRTKNTIHLWLNPLSSATKKTQIFNYFEIVKSPIISTENELIGILGICKDLTELKLQQIDLQINQKINEEIEKTISIILKTGNFKSIIKESFQNISSIAQFESIAIYFIENNSYTDSAFYLHVDYQDSVCYKKYTFRKKISLEGVPDNIVDQLHKNQSYYNENINLELINSIIEAPSYIKRQNKNNNKINNSEQINPVSLNISFRNKPVLIIPIFFESKIIGISIWIQSKRIKSFKKLILEENDILKTLYLSSTTIHNLFVYSNIIATLIDNINKDNLLKEQLINLQLAQEAQDMAFWTEDLKTQNIIASSIFFDLIGIPFQSNFTRQMLYNVFGEESRTTLDHFYNQIENEYFSEVELTILSTDQSLHIFLLKGKTLDFTNSKSSKIIGTILDITKQKQLTEQLKQTISMLEDEKIKAEQANEAKSFLLASLGHEIRNPLSSIIGLSTILNMDIKEERPKYYSKMILDSSKMLLQLINDILDFSKIETKKVEISSTPFSIRNMTDLLTEIFYLQAANKNISLHFIVDSSLPDIFSGDPVKIRQILINLIGNAIKFTEKGKVTVTIKSLEIKKTNKITLFFRVQDTGIGIEESSIEKIFQPFVQANASIVHKYGGSGLGLSITKQLIELMGGQINFRSIVNEGSTFDVKLPLTLIHSNKNFIKSLSKNEIDELYYFQRERLQLHGKENLSIFIDIEDELLIEKLISLLDYLNLDYIDLHNIKSRNINLDAPMPVFFVDNINKKNSYKIDKNIYTIVFLKSKITSFDENTNIDKNQDQNNDFFNVENSDDFFLLNDQINDGKIISNIIVHDTIYLEQPFTYKKLTFLILTLLKIPLEKNPENSIELSNIDNSNIKTKKKLSKYEYNKNFHILVAEDNNIVKEVLKYFLENQKYDAEFFENGQQVMEAITKKSFDLIFLDVNMPIMDGLQTAKAIRKMGITTPIISIAAFSKKEEIEQCFESGMDDYISKPIDEKQFFAKIDYYLNRIKPGDDKNNIEKNSKIETKIKNKVQTYRKSKDESKIKNNAKNYEKIRNKNSIQIRKKSRITNLEEKKAEENIISYNFNDLPQFLYLNKDQLLSITDKNIPIIKNVLKNTITQIPFLLDEIFDSLEKRDYKSFNFHLHTLKGTLYTAGSIYLGKEAEKLELEIEENKNENEQIYEQISFKEDIQKFIEKVHIFQQELQSFYQAIER